MVSKFVLRAGTLYIIRKIYRIMILPIKIKVYFKMYFITIIHRFQELTPKESFMLNSHF